MLGISILAPTRGATRFRLSARYFKNYFNPRSHEGSDRPPEPTDRNRQISILAPTRGATSMQNGMRKNLIFQSSLPRGERRKSAVSIAVMVIISILAPTRGATIQHYNALMLVYISILAPTRGATTACAVILISFFVFQSSLPRGERPLQTASQQNMTVISILAPTRGATSRYPYPQYIVGNFNPRSHEGSDIANGILQYFHINFNPRSHEGSDRSPR